jgi:hypothetical protein
MARDYRFRTMSAADLAMIRHWLETPEVMRWWGKPDEQYALVSGDLAAIRNAARGDRSRSGQCPGGARL